MTTPLVNQLTRNPARVTRLTELMQTCRYKYFYVTATIVGCGDAFIQRYWPVFYQLITRGSLHLTLVDREPITHLIQKKISLAQESGDKASAQKLSAAYHDLITLLEQRPDQIVYLNINDPRDQARYFHGTQDVVFVLVPDEIHIKYARDWLKRATLIIVEKPYNRDLVQAQSFEIHLQEMARVNGEKFPLTLVICIDHYLGKIFDFVMSRDDEMLHKQIGVINRVEFCLCEAGAVETWRAHSLEAGMIYDLFCHILAQISPFVQLQSFLQNLDSCRIKVAQHVQCPIGTESFAHIEHQNLRDYHDRRITLTGTIGKGIGHQDEKFLRIIGESATITANLTRHPGEIQIETNGHSRPLFNVGKGHQEMIEAIFSGNFIDNPIGGLTGETAVEILQILTSARSRIERHRSELRDRAHPLGMSIAKILTTHAISLD